jgi:hypothetical protein
VTLYPCGSPRPTASNLNYVAGSTVANFVLAKVGAGGKVCIYTQSTVNLIADVNGYFPALASASTLVPARLLDTRPGQSTVDGQSAGAGVAGAGVTTIVPVLNRGGVSALASTVVVNLTVTEPVGAGYATVFPCGIAPPLASNVNYVKGQTVANTAIVKVGSGGAICVISSQATHLVLDVSAELP